MDNVVIQLLREGKVVDAILSSHFLFSFIVIILLMTTAFYFIVKQVVKPLLSEKNAQETSKAISNLAATTNELATYIRQLHNTMSLLYHSIKNDSVSPEMLIWLIREVSELYPAMLISRILSTSTGTSQLDEATLLLAVETTLRDIGSFFISIPESPLENARESMEDGASSLHKTFVEEYLSSLKSQHEANSIWNDLFIIRAIASSHAIEVEKYLMAIMDITSLSTDRKPTARP